MSRSHSLTLKLIVFLFDDKRNRALVANLANTPTLLEINITNLANLGKTTFSEFIQNSISSYLGMQIQSVYFIKIAGLRYHVFAETNDVGQTSKLDRLKLSWCEIGQFISMIQDSETRQMIEDSVLIPQRVKLGKELSYLDDSTNAKAIAFVNQKINNDEGTFGWAQYMGSESIGSLSTAQGVLCYLHAGINAVAISGGIETIYRLQNDDGGWPVLKSLIGKSDISIVESAHYSLWALLEAAKGIEDEAVVRGVSFLERMQRPSGGWCSSASSERERTFPTALATRVLSMISQQSTSVKRGVMWLEQSQNADGGWGVFAGTSSTPLHTAHAVLALISAGTSPQSSEIRNGVQFILNSYTEEVEEGWPSESEVEYVDKDSALDFRHYTTPWCIVALISAGVTFSQRQLLRSVLRLISAQNPSGYWVNKLSPGQAPLWATHDCLFALNYVASSVGSHLDVVVVAQDRSEELSITQAALLNTQNQMHSLRAQLQEPRFNWIVIWNVILTLALIAVLLFSFKLIPSIGNSKDVASIISSVSPLFLAFAVGFAPFIYQIATEEYRIRRNEGKRDKRGRQEKDDE